MKSGRACSKVNVAPKADAGVSCASGVVISSPNMRVEVSEEVAAVAAVWASAACRAEVTATV